MAGGEELRTPAVVLRTVDYGEADTIVTFLTRDFGRVGAFARGARSTRKPRFGAVLQPTTELDIGYRRRPGSTSDLVNLVRADVVETYGGIRSDLDRITWASYALEIANEGSREGQDTGVLFRLLTGHLEVLASRGTYVEDRTAFELAMLAAMGLTVRLDRCGSCGEVPSGPAALSAHAGGLVCARDADRGAVLLSPGTWKSIRAVAGTIPPARPQVRFTGAVGEELSLGLASYIEQALGKPLRTLSFMKMTGLLGA